MSSTVTTLLTLLATIVGGLTDNSAITNVITTLEQIIAAGIAEVEAVTPYIKNIISALQNNSAVTADQMTQLAALDQATDAAFEAAATAAGAPPNPTS
jgi:hypothetical protein